jgi:hypothetical protein
MMTLNEFKDANNVSYLFAKLFESRNFAHKAHLSTKSYAQHKALGTFYEDVLDLVDDLVETYQGQYGLIKIDMSPSKESDVVQYFEDLARFLTEAHGAFDKKDTHLHNILDELTALTYRTLYKLKFLK